MNMTTKIEPSEAEVAAFETALASLPDSMTSMHLAAFFHGVMARYGIEGERRAALLMVLLVATKDTTDLKVIRLDDVEDADQIEALLKASAANGPVIN
jgi:hypothetical protein